MANRDFKIELDNVEMINGSDDLLKDTKVTKVTLTGENKLNSLNSTFENCTELTSIEGDINLDGISDMTEMALNTSLDELKVTNPTEENIQTDNSLNQVTNVKIGGTKYAKGGVQDVVGSLEWNAENFTYEDAILDNVYSNSSSIEESKNITVSDTLEQKATSIEITGQTYTNLVNGKATKNLLNEMSMQQVEGLPTQFTPHMEQPICLEYMEGETYQNLIKGKGEYKLTDSYSATWTESNISIENPPNAIEIPEIWGNTVQDENDLNIIQSVGDLYVDESGEPILDEEGNEQYKLEIKTHSKNYFSGKFYLRPNVDQMVCDDKIFVKPSTTYTLSDNLGYQYIVRQYNKKGVFLESIYPFSGDTIVTQDSCFYLLIGTYQNKGFTDINVQLQIEEGEVITEYEPYKEDKTTVLMPRQLKKIGSIKKYHQSTGDKWYPACSKLYYDYNAQKFFMKHVPTVEHDILNVLTTMNPFVEITTKSYNSEDYYAIDIHFSINNNKFGILGIGGADDICFMVKTNYPLPILTDSEARMNWGTSNTTKLEGYSFGYVGSLSHGWSFLLHIKSSNFGDRTLDKDGVIDFFTTYPTSFVALKNQDYTVYLETLDNVYDIVETKILEKPSLDAYSPKTYITTNTEIQPSQMSITNKEVKFIPLSLQPSKSYTIQLDSVGKDNKPITVNLGGTETTIQPTNDTSKHHRVSITTPSELTTDNLDLSGEGVVVNDVMLFEGGSNEIKQDVDYMDGIQSIGELFESRNLFDYTQSELGFLSISTGGISSNTAWKYTTNLISVKPNTTYCISQTSNSEFYYNIVEYNSSQSYLKGTSWEDNSGAISNRIYNTFTTSANTYYIRLNWKVSSSEIQLEEGLIPTEFRVFGSERYKIEIETYDSRWDSI